MKLLVEEQEALLDLMQSDNWGVLLSTAERILHKQEQAVLKLSIEDGNVTRLIHDKLRCEGARRLLVDIKNLEHIVKKAVKDS